MNHHQSMLELKFALATHFNFFSTFLPVHHKGDLLNIIQRYYLTTVSSVIHFAKNITQIQKEEVKLKIQNSLEIKMIIIQNMHFLLDQNLPFDIKESFASCYTHLESATKDNWRIRLSIFNSLTAILEVFHNPELINKYILPVYIGLCQDQCAFLRKQSWQIFGLIAQQCLYSGNLTGFFFLIER